MNNICHDECLHGYAIKYGLDEQVSVATALISMYAKLGDIDSNCNQVHSSRKLFDRMANKNTISWHTMISGCVYEGKMEKAIGLLWKMK